MCYDLIITYYVGISKYNPSLQSPLTDITLVVVRVIYQKVDVFVAN